jgi:hypothetical protein
MNHYHVGEYFLNQQLVTKWLCTNSLGPVGWTPIIWEIIDREKIVWQPKDSGPTIWAQAMLTPTFL